jgi:hypothetical protein
MKAIRKISAARHFLAVLVLAVVMSVFASTIGRAAAKSKPKGFKDPVIGNMTWEDSGSNDADRLTDGPIIVCDGNCVSNCDSHCDANCNGNCNANCPDMC